VLEWIPFEEVERLFAQALVLINTSLFEGFPNTFLQAGKYAVPLLSLQVDPDGFIEGYECGIVARGRFDMLVEGLDVIRSDQARHSLFARNIRGYVQKHHSLAQKVRQLDQILAALKSNG
jgi:glycosyltransferase involved in cell wall biosynthesis